MVKLFTISLLCGLFISFSEMPVRAATPSTGTVEQTDILVSTGFFGGIKANNKILLILSPGVVKNFAVTSETRLRGGIGKLADIPLNTPIHLKIRGNRVVEIELMGRTK
jgi:hypothetical protein